MLGLSNLIIDEIYLNPKSSNYKLTYTDNAMGISLSTFLSKLLVPSISSKTLEKFLNKPLDWDISQSKSRYTLGKKVY